MRVVSDTSPISNLAIIGRLDLLKRRYGELGELLHARQTGMLPNLRSEINRLRAEPGFFVGAEPEREIALAEQRRRDHLSRRKQK